MSFHLLQTTTTGSVAPLLFFVGAFASIVVGIFVAYRAYKAYRRTGRRQLLLFCLGLLLLVSIPTIANFALASVFSSTTLVGPVTEFIRLCGAVVMLYAIYEPFHTEDRRKVSRDAGDSLQSNAVIPLTVVFVTLQSITVEETSTSIIESVLVLILIGVGCLLTYQAVRGFRRNNDASLIVFAIGVALLTVVHGALKLSPDLLIPLLSSDAQQVTILLGVTSQFVDIAGLIAVFYAIFR